MRMTSTLKTVFIFFLGFGTITFLIIWVPQFLSDDAIEIIKTLAGFVFILVTGIPIIYITFSAFFATTNEYATGIFEVYVDKNLEDLHVFTYCNQSRAKSGQAPLRLIQHYFLVAKTGKVYYHVLFWHSLESLKGSSGYEGFRSFADSVLDTPELATSMKQLSDKTGQQVALGELLKADPMVDYLYVINPDRQLQITKSEKLFGFQHKALYIDRNMSKVLWKRKI